MTKLSVNINKIATLRNSRGGDLPNVVKAALDAERFGAQGITVHPRPDERHIRYRGRTRSQARDRHRAQYRRQPHRALSSIWCSRSCPAQVTLVPDAHDAVTSNAGWDTDRAPGVS